jgi:Protein of unknown function (DUF3619)
MTRQTPASATALTRIERAEARFGRRVTALLSEAQARQPQADVDERLRFAREQALERARAARRQTAPASLRVGSGGAAALAAGPADSGNPWWLRLSSLLPLAVLLAGLLLIDDHYTRAQIEAAAEVDAALLADDLPPEAYSDPGFVEYLRSARP